MLEEGGSIGVCLGLTHQIWLCTVDQGAPLSACTQATVILIIPIPLHWYFSSSLKFSFSFYFEKLLY